MSTLEFPEIAEQPAAPVAVVEPKQATLKETALASFAPIVAHMATLARRYKDVAFDLMTPKGLAEAKAARLVLREEGRYAVQRLHKRLKDEANDLKRTIDAKADEAIAIIKPVEDDIHARIEAREQAIEAEKEAKRQAEEARLQGLRGAITENLAPWVGRCNADGITAARISLGIEALQLVEPLAAWAEVEPFWQSEKSRTLAAMRDLQIATQQREDAARLENERLENERIAAEQRAQAEALAAQQRALVEQAAELARQQQEIEAARQRANAPAATAATEGNAETPEPSPPILLQDEAEGRGLSRALAGKPDAMLQAREAAAAIEANTTSEAAPQHASDPVNPEADAAPGGTEGGDFDLITGPAPAAPAADAGHVADIAGRDWTDVAFIGEAKPYTGSVQIVTEPASKTSAIADLIRLRDEARGSKFPSQPKVGPEWFTAFYAAVDALESERA